MRRRTHCGPRSPVVAVALAAVIAGGPPGVPDALAQDDTEPIRLSYRAPEGCPDEASFVARVRERTKRTRLAWAGEPARTFTVIVEAGPPPSGRVGIQAGGESQGMRRVQADTCSDVADALALVIALAIDPRAKVAAAPSAAPAPAASSALPSEAPAPKPAGAVAAVFAGAEVTVATDIAPKNVLVGGSPFVGWRSAGATIWQPSVRLAFARAGSGPLDVEGGRAAFTWTVGRLDVCPIVWPRGTVRLTECVRVEAGTLEGARADVTSPPSQRNLWLAAGLLARVEWSPLAWAFVDADLGGLVRVQQDRFKFRSFDPPFYEVPPVGLTAGVGVGVRFF